MNSWSKYRTTDRCGRLGCPKTSTSDSRVSKPCLTETGDNSANLKRLVVFQHGDCGLPSATCEPVTRRGRRLAFSGLLQQQHSSRGSRAGMSEHSLPDLLCDGPCYLLCCSLKRRLRTRRDIRTGIRRARSVRRARNAPQVPWGTWRTWRKALG